MDETESSLDILDLLLGTENSSMINSSCDDEMNELNNIDGASSDDNLNNEHLLSFENDAWDNYTVNDNFLNDLVPPSSDLLNDDSNFLLQPSCELSDDDLRLPCVLSPLSSESSLSDVQATSSMSCPSFSEAKEEPVSSVDSGDTSPVDLIFYITESPLVETHETVTTSIIDQDTSISTTDLDYSNLNRNQPIKLTDEEKRLLKKEGVELPKHFPLTKNEERDLKRIRRKIRNKQSAMNSRKRKKQYMDGLENRVKACTNQNLHLQKRVDILQKQNLSLLQQLKKMQELILKCGSTKTSTCVMVLLLSFGLFMFPSIKFSGSQMTEKQSNVLNPNQETSIFSRSSRNLLHNDDDNGDPGIHKSKTIYSPYSMSALQKITTDALSQTFKSDHYEEGFSMTTVGQYQDLDQFIRHRDSHDVRGKNSKNNHSDDVVQVNMYL